jgi:uncharacterized protein YggE
MTTNERSAGRHGRPAHWLGVGGAATAVSGLALAALWGMPAALPGDGLPSPAYAQEARPADSRSVSVVGEGTVQARPDTATIRLGVQVTAPSPAEALGQTRQAADTLLEQLRGQGVQEKDVQTTNLNVYPITAPNREGGGDPAQITGYRGTATVVVNNQDLGKASQLLNVAVQQAGVTSVQGVTFGIRDPSQLQRDALNAAIAQARQEAEAAAGAAGLRLAGIRAVQEVASGQPGPVPQGLGGGAGNGGGGGIAPGELTVTARVQVTFDVA